MATLAHTARLAAQARGGAGERTRVAEAQHGAGARPDGATAVVAGVLRGDWVRVRRAATRIGELFPWRPLGVVLTVAAYAALKYFAYARLDLVWLVVGYVALGLALLCPLAVVAAAAWLKVRGATAVTQRPLVLETGVSARTGFKLPSLRWMPLVEVRWEWSDPQGSTLDAPAGAKAGEEWVRMHDRGRFALIVRRVFVEDPFGVSRLVVRMREDVAIEVLPRLAGLRHLPPLSAFASGDALPHPLGLEDGDRMELRRYTPGDPARWIHWKLLGRTRKLIVRMPERALTPARRTAAFLVAGPDDDASAAMARLALERGLLGSEWVFGTDAEPTLSERLDEALDSLIGSSAARDRGGVGLAAFVERVETKGPASVLVFVPAQPGPWLERVAEYARRRKLHAVIGVDGVAAREGPPWWQRALWFWAAPQGTPAAALEEVVWALGAAGAQVLVMDRESGARLTEAHRDAMRALELHAAVGA